MAAATWGQPSQTATLVRVPLSLVTVSQTLGLVSMSGVAVVRVAANVNQALEPLAQAVNLTGPTWRAVLPADGSWSAAGAATGTWGSATAAAGTWTSETPADGTWTPRDPAGGSWS